MATVPVVDTLRVSANTLPAATISQNDTSAIGGFAASQSEQLGAAMQNAGQMGMRMATDMQQQANQIRVDEALNAVKESQLDLTYGKENGYANLKGSAAFQRDGGKPLADEYGEKLQSRIDELSATLGNDAQRAMLKQHAQGMVLSMRERATLHETAEFKNHSLSVAEGIQSTALRDIGLNWNNPQVVESAVERIKAETYRQAQLLGKSGEWQEAQARKMTSNGHKVALLAALESNDANYANSYLKKFSDQMDADDILAVRGHITKEMNFQLGATVAGEVLGRMQPKIQTGDAERAFNIAVGTESGGKQFDTTGAPLTSPKGAIGIAQVMPDTAPEAAKLAGVAWDENRYKTDAGYNKALGLAYFQKQLQDHGGDLPKAYAAYNAGPGALQAAIKKADQSVKLAKNDPTVPVRAWIDFMPKETRDYVAKNMKAYESGQGNEPRATMADIDAQLRSDPRLAGKPEALKLARSEADRQFDEQTKAIKQKEDESVAAAMKAIVENGGRYSDLPASVRMSLPPKEIDNVMAFAQKIAKGDDTTSLYLYNSLTAHPEQLAKMTDAQFYALRRELNEGDFKHFSNERAKMTGATQGSNGPGELNTSAIKQTLDGRLRMMQIDPSPKDDGGADAARIGSIRRFVDQYFMATQREAGKKFNDTEVAAHIDALFAKNTEFRGWFSNSSGPMLGMKIGDIPSVAKDGIKASFKKLGNDNPTDAQILNAYWSLKVASK